MDTRILKFLPFLILLITVFSCNDEYIFLKDDPSKFDGKSLYAILEGDDRFDVYTEMLQHTDSAYREILNRTGSRTLFVPTDDAFERFFQNNPYGIKSVKDMSPTLIKTFLSYYTLENAFVASSLGSSSGSDGVPAEGNCLRRFTTFLSTDTIPYTNVYPQNAQFERFNGGFIYLTTPGRWTMLNFTQTYFDKKFMKNEDFSALFQGTSRQNNDIHIFDAKVIAKDIIAMNGYIHVLDKVVLPPGNMYEAIRDMDDVSIFRGLLERFSEPVYDAAATLALRERRPEVKDSVFYIDFFDTSDRVIIDEYGNQTKVDPLPFSPSKNGAQTNASAGSPPADMPVMFIPTNEAMNDYLLNSYLRDYGDWSKVPNDVVLKFVRVHMKNSFINSLPSLLKDIVDDAQGDLMFPGFNYGEDVKNATVCRNGLVYTMNRVVAPRDFSTVVAPILNNPSTKIANWIINQSYNNAALKFNYYLTSLENEFTVFIPYDEAFLDYPDPLSQTDKTTVKRLMKFKYDENIKGVNFIYCNMNGDSIGVPMKPDFNNPNNPTLLTIQNRLQDVMDHHIVVGDIDAEQTYAQTKGGAYIKITRVGGQMRLQGAGDIEKGTYANIVEAFVDNNYIKNGKVYFIDKRLDHTLTSPLGYGTQHPECIKFYEMLELYNDPDATFFPNGAVIDPTKLDKETQEPIVTLKPFASVVGAKPVQQEYVAPIFSVSDGIDHVLPFLGLYDYTIFVPTDDAMNAAERAGLYKTVDQINAIGDFKIQVEEIKKVILFLKNHFVDGSVFTKQYYNNKDRDKYTGWVTHTTSAKITIERNNTQVKEFNEVQIGKQGETLVIRDKTGNEKARTVQGTENTITRQYRFYGNNILSNSRAVVCQINNVLTINE